MRKIEKRVRWMRGSDVLIIQKYEWALLSNAMNYCALPSSVAKRGSSPREERQVIIENATAKYQLEA
ncbi:hypothetical protein [Pseudomonas sp. NMS19W]|uniref:hypothetical protein n=1 Tax=Pseudomonas sp. NMS19W TaxID=3079768 RepID=UPI003F660C38